MGGTKSFCLPDSNSDSNFQNKRLRMGSSNEADRVESSQEHIMATTALDEQRRAESSQHVRDLNIQFASWVQTQLKDHPDEIWEDGIRDYLDHASNIMEKFSDVVNWLKVNGAKGENLAVAGSQTTAEKKKVSESTNNDKNKYLPMSESTGVFSNNHSSTEVFSTSKSSTGVSSNGQSSPVFSTDERIQTSISQSSSIFSNCQSSGVSSDTQSPGLFSNLQSPGLFFNSQNPGLLGNQSLAESSGGFSNTPSFGKPSFGEDDGNDVSERPSSPSVKRSEEKGVAVVHEVECKLYVKSTDPANGWTDKGSGKLTIRCKEGVSKGTKESKPTVIVRNNAGKPLLNALLYSGIKTNPQKKNSLVAIFHTACDGFRNQDSVVARTFLIRMRSEEDRNRLATAIQEYAPASQRD